MVSSLMRPGDMRWKASMTLASCSVTARLGTPVTWTASGLAEAGWEPLDDHPHGALRDEAAVDGVPAADAKLLPQKDKKDDVTHGVAEGEESLKGVEDGLEDTAMQLAREVTPSFQNSTDSNRSADPPVMATKAEVRAKG